MLYEKYQNRIMKISAVKSWIKRRRVPIIAAAALIFILLTGFFSVKGVIYSAADIPAQITYGESVAYSANAFFEKVSYEYAKYGSDEWTDVQPIRAGTYQVRAVSKRTFGAPSYGKAQVYEILPKAIDVSVSESALQYGGTPSVSATLVYEDRIVCSRFDYADLSQNNTQVTAVKNAIVISDSQGLDVTDSYIINLVTGDIAFTKREITVTTADKTAVYDGTPLAFEGYEMSGGSLADGDTLVATFDKARVDAGETENTAQFKVVSRNGINVTANYAIEVIAGKLTVEKRPVYIKTESAEKIYDGKPLNFTNHAVSTDTLLISGHRLELVSATALTDVGSCENLLVFKILDGDGNDVTGNYSFLFPEDSKLKVTARPIKIQTDGGSKSYDGQPLTAESYSIISDLKLLDNHSMEVVFDGLQTRAGGSFNTVKKIIITEDGKDVTGNYAVDYKYGVLMVIPRIASVVTETAELVYSGKAQTNGGFEVVSGLIGGQTPYVKAETLTYLTNIGNAQNELSVGVLDSEGNDVSDCYIFNYTYGTLTVRQLAATVTTATADFYFNGSEQYNGGHTIAPLVADGQTVRVTETTLVRLRNVEKLGNGNYREYQNIFEISIFSGEEEVTYNYDLSYIYGTLKMLPCTVTVTTAERQFVYNGQEQFDDSYSVSFVAEGHTTRLKTGIATTVLEVDRLPGGGFGGRYNVFEVAFHSGNEDVSYNYNIRYEYGILTVLPLNITVTTNTNSWIYDDMWHSDSGYGISENSLVSGQESGVLPYIFTAVKTVFRLTNGTVTSVNNIFQIEIHSGSTDVTHNYEITYIYGTLTINPRQIEITSTTNSWVYDGETHYDYGYQVTSITGFVSGHNSWALYVTSIKDVIRLDGGAVGSKENWMLIEIYSGAAFDSVTSNYDITYIYGTLTITPRPIEVTTNSNSWIYDGLPHFDWRYTISAGTLVSWHTSAVAGSGGVVTENCWNVGSRINEFYIEIFNTARDTFYTYNYDITYVFGTLTITPRPITVKPENRTKEYDRKPLTSSEYIITSVLKLVEGQFAEISCSGSQTEIGSSANFITGFKIFSGDEDVTNNYAITLENGTLTVTKRTIVIKADDAKKIYDGTPLTCGTFTVYNSVLSGHTLTAQTSGSQTEVGISDNSIVQNSVTITEDGNDVSGYYSVFFVTGTLQVGLVEITLKTASAEKEFDGTPLRDGGYEIIGIENILAGHTPTVTVTGYQIAVGSSFNTARIIFKDSGGYDVSYSYLVTLELGTLTVTGIGGGGSGMIDREGDGGTGGPPVVLFKATSEVSGPVYFRNRSFGDYLLDGWDPNIASYQTDIMNPLYLSYLSLERSGKVTSLISVEPLVSNLAYMLPYYARNGYDTTNDVQINSLYNSVYSFNYIPYTYKSSDKFSVGSGSSGYAQFERDYYEYVLNTYLQLPETTRLKMLEVAAKNNLIANSPSIIEDVAKFVQNKVKYDFNYKYLGDVAVYFFTQAKTGICQHYATAATAMLRAHGNPPPNTTGYVGNMSAGKAVEITTKQAHAWVEIYLSGMGWVQIEVTGGGNGSTNPNGNGGDSGDGSGGLRGTLSIKPVDVYKVYDGTPLNAKNEIEGADLDSVTGLKNLLELGYRFTSGVTGSRTEFGVSDSTITDFILYDPYGKNVTEQLNIIYRPGRIRIIHQPIFINVYSLQKYYDGTPLAYDSQDYWVESLPDGFRLEFSMSGSLTNAGMLNLSDFEALPYTVYDQYNRNVTDQYSLVFQGEPMKVFRRVIEITSASVTKTYDGKALSSSLTWISKGYFPPTHRYEATVTGKITDVGETYNKISAVRIYDAKGNEVTSNYDIRTVNGILKVLSQ